MFDNSDIISKLDRGGGASKSTCTMDARAAMRDMRASSSVRSSAVKHIITAAPFNASKDLASAAMSAGVAKSTNG